MPTIRPGSPQPCYHIFIFSTSYHTTSASWTSSILVSNKQAYQGAIYWFKAFALASLSALVPSSLRSASFGGRAGPFDSWYLISTLSPFGGSCWWRGCVLALESVLELPSFMTLCSVSLGFPRYGLWTSLTAQFRHLQQRSQHCLEEYIKEHWLDLKSIILKHTRYFRAVEATCDTFKEGDLPNGWLSVSSGPAGILNGIYVNWIELSEIFFCLRCYSKIRIEHNPSLVFVYPSSRNTLWRHSLIPPQATKPFWHLTRLSTQA